MTAVHDGSSRIHSDGTLAPALRAAHEIWLRETNRFLLPITLRPAPFWPRWTAVRYLADQFLSQYRRERALLEELRALLPRDVAERLTEHGERIGQLQGELNRIGRRRGEAQTMAVLGHSFLQLLRSWCADIETAAGGISREALTSEGRRLLIDVERYTASYA